MDGLPAFFLILLGLFFVSMRNTESLGMKELSIGDTPARELVETGRPNQAFPELPSPSVNMGCPVFL